MILYLDASALVKRYIGETGTAAVNDWIDAADVIGTGNITRVEVAAAITRAARMKIISLNEAGTALGVFRSEWSSISRLPITENSVTRGDLLACEHHLRGYDAVQLACAVIWQETLGFPITFCTFDSQLSKAARSLFLPILPEKI